MRRTILVALGENARSLGTLRFDAQGARENAAFAYDAAWLVHLAGIDDSVRLGGPSRICHSPAEI